ncbi:hypothetical protein BaRGS_00003727 [Batillaria attramentaria]|uniref:Uncharacterized protein n=1 Tax=Batillaria attramentaria TaxID=370345 RepID=A0ABD0M0F3_9CAEN
MSLLEQRRLIFKTSQNILFVQQISPQAPLNRRTSFGTIPVSSRYLPSVQSCMCSAAASRHVPLKSNSDQIRGHHLNRPAATEVTVNGSGGPWPWERVQ